MNRRFFLIATAASLTGILSYIVGQPYLKDQAINFIKTLLKNKLNYLTLNEEGLEQYCEAFFIKKSKTLMIKSGLAGISLQWIDDLDIIKRKIGTERIATLEKELTLSYLLSTDFFINGSNESIPVNFVSYYDPNLPVCRHPFARLS
ncbi:MAG: hypothetical protein QM500_13920 [Methylococcales bacterium]